MYPGPRHKRSRVISALLSLALVLGMFWVLIALGIVDLDRGASGGAGALLTVRTGQDDSAASAAHATRKAQRTKVQPTPQAPQTPAYAKIPTPVAVPSATPPPGFIHMTHDEMASADIAKMGHAQGSGAGSGDDGSKTYGPGEGPGGEHLFPAEWFREPSAAEVNPYLIHGVPPGATADIACRMIEHYHVENCQELDENPPGYGLARGLRLASWQFLVRPPVVNGKAMIGAWVRIHWSWTGRKVEVEAQPEEGARGDGQ